VDYCSKPTSGKYFMKPYIEKIKTFQKRAAGVAPCVGPEFKPQYYKKKKKTISNRFKHLIRRFKIFLVSLSLRVLIGSSVNSISKLFGANTCVVPNMSLITQLLSLPHAKPLQSFLIHLPTSAQDRISSNQLCP
jgi:hypothetical protein